MERLLKVENFSENQIAFLIKLSNCEVDDIKWDLDQVLARSEDAVKKAFDEIVGTNYYLEGRRIDCRRALTAWAFADGVLSEEAAMQLEDELWVSPEVLLQSPPNEELQIYSRLAHAKGKKQGVVTSRIPELRNISFDWLEKYYPWISKENIFIRNEENLKESGSVYKANVLARLGAGAFFEDTAAHVEEILARTTNIPIIFFPRPLEVNKFADERVMEFSEMTDFFKLLQQFQEI